MRYSAAHKDETRQRIVRTAARHFRRGGEKGVAIADLMSKLKLTHGGFYKHFDSKDELLTEALVQAFDETEKRFGEAVRNAKPGTELKVLIGNFLSLEHCANPGAGCPMAAIVSEIPRLPRSVRNQVEQAMKRRVKAVSRLMPGSSAHEREQNAVALMAGMIGTINIARVLTDPAARKAMLDASKNFYIKSFCH